MITRLIIDCVVFGAGYYIGYKNFKKNITPTKTKSEADQEREIIERYKQNNE